MQLCLLELGNQLIEVNVVVTKRRKIGQAFSFFIFSKCDACQPMCWLEKLSLSSLPKNR